MLKSRIFDRVTAGVLWWGDGNVVREGARSMHLGTCSEELPEQKAWEAKSPAVGAGKGVSARNGGRMERARRGENSRA